MIPCMHKEIHPCTNFGQLQLMPNINIDKIPQGLELPPGFNFQLKRLSKFKFDVDTHKSEFRSYESNTKHGQPCSH